MKKIFGIFAIILAVLLSSCTSKKVNYPDYISGNPSDIYGNPIMETEDGFYTNLHSFNLSLCYYDKATGKAVFLCAKPECQHDGNKFCTATKKGVIYDGNICKSGEYVYYAASEYAENEEKEYYKLIRAKADGTEFTELCTFQTTVNRGVMHSILGENYGRVIEQVQKAKAERKSRSGSGGKLYFPQQKRHIFSEKPRRSYKKAETIYGKQ